MILSRLRVIFRQLDRRLDGFRARIAEVHALLLRARSNRRKLFRELRQSLVVEIRAGQVNQFGRLLLNRSDHFRMAVAGGAHGDARGKIQERVSVHIFNRRAVAALRHQRIIARVRRRDVFRVALDDALSFGSRQRHQQAGQFCFGGSNHFFLLGERRSAVDVAIDWMDDAFDGRLRGSFFCAHTNAAAGAAGEEKS